MICGYTMSFLVAHMRDNNVAVYVAIINGDRKLYFYPAHDNTGLKYLRDSSDNIHRLNSDYTWSEIRTV